MSIRIGQTRLRKLAEKITNETPLDQEDRAFLSSALKDIADGGDAEIALDVKANRGERKSEHVRITKRQLEFFLPWVATATLPEDEGGLGYTIEKAVSIGREQFLHLASKDTLIRYFNDYKKTGSVIFTVEPD